jgi:hypothetical protein
MVASTSNGNGNGNGGGGGGCAFSSEKLGREPSKFAAAVQRVEACLAGIQGINERMAAMAEQRRQMYDELRTIQGQINEEFDRILTKPGRATPTKVVTRAVKAEAVAAVSGAQADVVARLPQAACEGTLVRAEA